MTGTSCRFARIPRGAWRTIGCAAILLACWNGISRGQGLIGLGSVPGQPTQQVLLIDPVTGARTPILSTEALGLTSATLAFDPITRRLFFEDGTDLWTVDLINGTSSHLPIDYCCPFLQYDSSARVLLGLGFLTGAPTAQVFSIDPVTGARTAILSTGAAGITATTIGFDPLTRRVFFEDGTDLWTGDLVHGTSSHVSIDYCCPALVFSSQGGPAVNVPLLGPASLILLVAGLAILGWFFAGRV